MINSNLLPPEIKDQQKIAKENRDVLRLVISLVLFIMLIGLFFAGLLFFFSNKLTETNNRLAEKEQSIKKYGGLEDKAKKISERITNISQIMSNSNVWSGTTEEIQKIMPAGVTLSSIKIDSNTKTRNTIMGHAVSKKEVAALRDAMEKSEKFEFVDIETSSTENNPTLNKEVENFTLTFSLSKGALK